MEQTQRAAKLFLIILVLAILAASIWYIYKITKPTEEEISSKMEQVLVVPVDILKSDQIQTLNNLRQNGTLPIVPQNQSKDNPFSGI